MAKKICQGGLLELFTKKLEAVTGSWMVRLSQVNVAPAVVQVVGAFTEATYSGYAAQALTTAYAIAWNSGTLTYNALWPLLVFTGNGGGTNQVVYQYYVTDAAGALVWAEDITSPPTLGPTTVSLGIQISLNDLNQF